MVLFSAFSRFVWAAVEVASLLFLKIETLIRFCSCAHNSNLMRSDLTAAALHGDRAWLLDRALNNVTYN
jgi:hypothetical protein